MTVQASTDYTSEVAPSVNDKNYLYLVSGNIGTPDTAKFIESYYAKSKDGSISMRDSPAFCDKRVYTIQSTSITK